MFPLHYCTEKTEIISMQLKIKIWHLARGLTLLFGFQSEEGSEIQDGSLFPLCYFSVWPWVVNYVKIVKTAF